jgi:hypothetical protein
MKDIITGAKRADDDFIPELKHVFDLLALTLRKKMQGLRNGGIIGIVYDLEIDCFNRHQLRDMAQNIIGRPEFADFTDYTLILLKRSNDSQYKSLLIGRGQEPLVREQLGP